MKTLKFFQPFNANRIYFFRLQKFTIKFCVLISLFFITADIAFSQNSDPKLAELRKQFAVNYFKPEAHFTLAKYYLEKGDQLNAFFILEYARRYRFPEETFDEAFVKFFGDNSPEPDAKAKEAFEKAYELLKQNKMDEAEKSFIAAANLAPKSGFIQGWVGRFFYKAKPNNEIALKYYFNAYFLNPHTYETEFVESRIRNIAVDAAEIRFAELLKSGKTLTELSADDNPLIAGAAISQMAKQWKPEYYKPLLKVLENDDSEIRWFVFGVLFKNAGASSKEFISALSNDADLRKRGLAAYALIETQKEKSFIILKKMLADNAELIRFDAISALALKGGEPGREILRAHQKAEPNPLLKELIKLELERK